MLALSPHHSWITTTAGNGPLPFGRLRYALVPSASVTCSPARTAGPAVGGACIALNSASVSGPVCAGTLPPSVGSCTDAGLAGGVLVDEQAARIDRSAAILMDRLIHR